MIHPNIKFLRSIGMMIGAIIGVGVLGLPYAFAQSGAAIGMLELLIIATLLTFLQLMFAEVCLQTPGKHRLVGLVGIYVGKKWRMVALSAMAFGIWGAMIAYMIVGGRFLHILLEPILGGTEMMYSIAVWVIGVALISQGLKFASKIEVPIVIALLFLFVFIILASTPEISPENFFTLDASKAFVPYGVILFSAAGVGIVPEMADVLGKRLGKRYLGMSIMIAMSIILLLYAFFALAVVGVTGAGTTQTAFDGLVPFFGGTFKVLTLLLGSITILSIFMVVGIELLDTFKFDFKLKHNTSWFLVAIVPIAFFLLGVREFISLVGFIGGVFGGGIGILIALSYWNLKRSKICRDHHCINFPAFLTWAIIILFAGGIIYQIADVFLSWL